MVEQLVNRGDRATYSGNRRSYYSSKDTPLLDCVPTTGPPSIEWKIGRGGGGGGGKGSISAIARNCCK